MAKRLAKPADMSWVSPYLVVKNAEAALDFYQRAFGMEVKTAMPGPDGKLLHAELRYKDCVIMFGPETSPGCRAKSPGTTGNASPLGLYLYCEDVDALYNRATAAGAKGMQSPADQFYGDRVCHVIDPDGYDWAFATNVADFDPSKAPK
jgi:uncharacterized glyoxalase superfamily protein PhnB